METTASSKEMTTGEGGGSEQITAADVTERITRTVIRTANYTSLTGGGDAGDTTTSSLAYEHSGLVGDEIRLIDSDDTTISADALLSGGGAGGGASQYSTLRLDRAQDDLYNYRRRIDANVEEQRDHASVLAGLQRKLEDHQRRMREVETQLTSRRPEEHVSYNIVETSDTWMPEPVSASGGGAADFEWTNRLEEERMRTQELRIKNEQLTVEIQRLHQQMEYAQQEYERAFQLREQMREKGMAEFLADQRKKMNDLLAELQHVRRQFTDYKDLTERELENQRNEFAKISRGVGGFSRHVTSVTSHEGSDTVINQDVELMEAVRRLREQQTEPKGASAEDYDTLMKKYEEAIERILELESRGEAVSGKGGALETELKRLKEKYSECQEFLRKINDATRDKDAKNGARSLSPGGSHVVPSEVHRNVRHALRIRDKELQQLQRKLKNAETEVTDLTGRLESAEEARKRLEKQLADVKRDAKKQLKQLDDANRELKRMTDRLRVIESERETSETGRRKLEEEIRRLKLIIDESNADGVKIQLEDAEAQKSMIEDDYKSRIAELTRRNEALTDENKRLKGDLNGTKDKLRDLENQHNNVLRQIEEKDFAIKNLDSTRNDLMRDLENQRARYDMVSSELDKLQTTYTTTSKNTVAIEMSVKEIKQQRDDISKERDDLAHQLTDLQHKISDEMKRKEALEKADKQRAVEIEKMTVQITEYESELMIMRRHNDELDTQLKTSHARITTLENSLASAQKEIDKQKELNMKLQKEKNEIMNLKQKSDADLDQLREKLRKIEVEVEKLRAENQTLHDTEQKAVADYKTELNKVHQLERELKDAKAEIDELRRKLDLVDQDNKDRLENIIRLKSPASEKVDSYESTTVTEVRVKELGEKHKLDIQKLEDERDDLLHRIKSLQDELGEKQHTVDRQLTEIDDQKHAYESEINRLKSELAALEAKYQNELEDERDQHQHDADVLKATEEELRTKITLLETKLEAANDREKNLHNEIAEWEDKYDSVNKELQKVRDELDVVRSDYEKELEKAKTDLNNAQAEIKNLEAQIETLKSQLNSANDRANSLTRTVNEQNGKIRELTSKNRRLEEELADAKTYIPTLQADLESAETRLHSTEEQYNTMQIENNKLRTELDSVNRQLGILQNTNSANENELERLRKKVTQLTDINKQQALELENIRNERDQLDRAYRDKVKQVEQLSDAVKNLQAKLTYARQELHDVKEKLMNIETERNTLRDEVKKLQNELQFGRDQMMRKNDEFNAALDDLSNAHRTAEDGRVNAIQELESRKFEITDLQSRLDNAEERLNTLQQEYLKADRERDMLNDSMRRFQSIISHTVISETSVVDMQSLDVHLQNVMNRIEKLERERNDYRDSLSRLKRKTSDSTIAVTKHETLYRTIEDRVADVEEGKRNAEIKLIKAKELVSSQGEQLKQYEEERRTMKSKIMMFEMEARGKDAKIRHLSDLIKTLKSDLENARSEVHNLRDREDRYEMTKVHVEKQVTSDDSEARLRQMMTSFDNERQGFNETVRKLTSQLNGLQTKNSDLKDDVDKLKRDLSDAEKTEAELRRNFDEKSRVAIEVQHLKDQLSMSQSDLMSANGRKQQLETELSTMRSELRDHKQQIRDANTQVSDLQRQLQDANANKNRLTDKIHELDRMLTSQRTVENDLRNQLAAAVNDRRAVEAELEELRRRSGQMERERHGAGEKIEELKKIRITLIKKIEILETEKRKAEHVVSETEAQREAIERSLSTLEHENKELARSCAQLQKQIAQLEVDSGNRLITLTKRQEEEHDRFLQKQRAEIERRDRLHKSQLKQLESRIAKLTEQLNEERLRRRDESNRLYASSLSKISGSVFGMTPTSGMMSAGGALYPHAEPNIHSVIGSPRLLPNFYSTSRYSSLVSGTGGGSFIGSAGVGDSSRAHTIKLDEPDSVRDVGGVTSQQESSSIYQSSSSTGTPSTVLAAGTAAVGEDDEVTMSRTVKVTKTTTKSNYTEQSNV